MKEEIKNILDEYDKQIKRYEDKVETLVNKMRFCEEHNFQEEYRIANVEREAVDMCVYRWREMYKEILNVVKLQP